MATIPIQQGYVKSLQVFFEDFINNGTKRSKGNVSKMHLRRPEAAAPKSISPLIRDRMKTWLSAPKMATINTPDAAVSVLVDSNKSEPKRASLTNHRSLTSGQIINPMEDAQLSLEIGDNSDKTLAPNAHIRHRAGAAGKSSVAQPASGLMSSIVVPESPSYVKVDSMVIDNDPYMLQEIQQAVQEGIESDTAAKEAVMFEASPDDSQFTSSITEHVDIQNVSSGHEQVVKTVKPTSDDLYEHALFCARLVQDFVSEGNAEIHGCRGDTIVAYEVNDEGWCLVRNGDEFGWIPQSYLELIYPEDASAPSPFEIDFRLCVPRPEDRQAVLEFIESSSLFSEARAHSNVEVYTDMVDQILRGGRTITATLAALLELDRNRRNFPDLKSLAACVKQLRDRWDQIAQQCQELVRHGSMMLFNSPRTTLSSYQIMQLITDTTCGSDVLDRLQEEIACHARFPGFAELAASITAKQRARAKAKEEECKQGCQIVFNTLRRPDLRLFKGFIDLRQNPVLQLLYNGMDANQIVKSLEALAAQGKSFDSLENMMRAVFTLAGHDPSVLCMGQGSPVRATDSQQMAPQQTLQMKAVAIMTALSNQDIQLFTSLNSNVSVKMSDVTSLLAVNPSLPSILCNIGLLNWQKRQLSSFQDLIALQQDPSLLEEKLRVQSFLKDHTSSLFKGINGDQISIADTETFMNQSAAYGRFIDILQQILNQSKLFESISELSLTAAELYRAFHVQRQKDVLAISEWFGTNAIFSQQVELYDATIERLLDSAGSGEKLLSALQHFATNRIAFETIDALNECVVSFVKT